MTLDQEALLREQIFHNAVREYVAYCSKFCVKFNLYKNQGKFYFEKCVFLEVISLLLFILLYVSSYATVCAFRRRTEKEDCYSGDDEDAMVYRISLWICTFAFAVSLAAMMLVPISIVSNEVLILYPKSYYVQWLNSSLIHGLWNHVFLCSNLSLFILLPFAYFFTESEGFAGSKKGIMARVYETSVVLSLLAVLVFGLAWVASALIDDDNSSRQTLFDVWNVYLPYMYSGISLLGVLVLLTCTPLGFARLFTVMSQLLVKPQFFHDIEEELNTARFEEQSLQRKLNQAQSHSISNGHSNHNDIRTKLKEARADRIELEKRRNASSFHRNLLFPFVILLLLLLTGICVLISVQNIFELLIGLKALPFGTQEAVLGITSLSKLGPFGAAVEIVLILYLMLASLVGLYSVNCFRGLRPVPHDTPMTKIIGNGIILLLLSSALPVLSRTLGITNFNLLGDFGRMDWLGNMYLIISYNMLFIVTTVLCLTKKFTAAVRKELLSRIGSAFTRSERVPTATSPTTSGVGRTSGQ